MASRNMAPVRSLQRGLTKIVGRLTGNGTNAPTNLLGVGIRSATREAAGRYRVVFTGRYTRLLHVGATVLPGVTGTTTPTVATARVVNALMPRDVVATGNVLATEIEFFVTNNTGTEALTDLAAGEVLSFEVCFVNSRTPPPRGN
jgi:hypothetical protein